MQLWDAVVPFRTVIGTRDDRLQLPTSLDDSLGLVARQYVFERTF
jgi:hypothetical protein